MDLSRAKQLLAQLPIRDRESRVITPFKLNPNQVIFMDRLEAWIKKKKLPRIIVLKARRVGISSLTEGLAVCHCLAKDGAKAVIVAHQFASSQALFEVPTNLVTLGIPGQVSLAEKLGMPTPTKHKIEFPHKRSKSELSIATAGSIGGGRGMAHSFLHLSEVAKYTNGQEAFLSLLPTVPNDPDTMIVLESTANGRVYEGQLFYEYWNAAVKGENDYLPIFLSWLDDKGCVDWNIDVSDAPADEDERILMKDWKARPEQIAFRRLKIGSECRGYSQLFAQEYPAYPEEAFISSGDPAFTVGEISTARASIIPEKKRGIIRMTGNVPTFKETSNGELYVWEEPQPRCKYYIGADAARGVDTGDFAALVVFNGDTGEYAARYVGRIGPQALAYLMAAVGYWYGKAMINVELTGNLGVWAQKVLRDDIAYPSIYKWKGSRDDKIGKSMSRSIGWETTARSREMAMTAFREAIHYKVITIRDEALISQMDMCTRRDSWQRWDIEHGHDDLLMAALIANITRAQWHPKRISHEGGTIYSEETKLPSKVSTDRTAATVDDVVTLQAIDNYNEVMAAIKRGDNPRDPLRGI